MRELFVYALVFAFVGITIGTLIALIVGIPVVAIMSVANWLFF